MIEYVGNCNNKINWNLVIDHLTDKTPSKVGPFYNIENLEHTLESYKKSKLILREFQGTVGWDIFLPGVDFDIDIVHRFAKFVNVESYTDAWITKLSMGMMIPPFKEFNMPGPRWYCHITEKAWGHVTFVENETLYSQEQGSVYRWDKTAEYAVNNVGLVPQYFFNFY